MGWGRRVRKWNQLSGRSQWMWIKAAVTLTWIYWGLRILPFDRFKDWYRKVAIREKSPLSEAATKELVWAVESAARHLPMVLQCLPQSLAVKYLLGQTDGVRLTIGFNKDSKEGFQFHAWVEQNGKKIIGELPVAYQPMWVWE